MSDQPRISQAFLTFRDEAPDHAAAWGEMVQKVGEAIAAYDA